MTETVNASSVVISAERPQIKENIVDRKTIVYQATIDPAVIRVAGEKLKQQLFTRLGLFKPKAEEIQFISLDKYYEPYMVISGKYFLDYYCKSTYVFKVNEGVKEVVLLNHKFIPEQSRSTKSIQLYGEERLIKEGKAFLVLDKNGNDLLIDNLPSAPSEKNPKKVLEEYEIEEIPENTDVNYVRQRIAQRPKNVNRIVEEVFEITERSLIYTPRFKLLFRNLKSGEEKVMIIDGITSKKI
ncbi:hypothetical protein E2P61_04310 [Candidatus Bathyarchaeota archaeon]|nr:hypothetical protein E2P61_04310 [Candidatus Bathyarchaeota archaeon]